MSQGQRQVKLTTQVTEETLMNLRRHALVMSGPGRQLTLGQIIDKLVKENLPDYEGMDVAVRNQAPVDQGPTILRET